MLNLPRSECNQAEAPLNRVCPPRHDAEPQRRLVRRVATAASGRLAVMDMGLTALRACQQPVGLLTERGSRVPKRGSRSGSLRSSLERRSEVLQKASIWLFGTLTAVGQGAISIAAAVFFYPAASVLEIIALSGLYWSLLGLLLSSGLWAVGSFSNNYTQSVNGKRGFIVTSAGSALFAVAGVILVGYSALLPLGAIVVVVVLVAGLLALARYASQRHDNSPTIPEESRELGAEESAVAVASETALLQDSVARQLLVFSRGESNESQ